MRLTYAHHVEVAILRVEARCQAAHVDPAPVLAWAGEDLGRLKLAADWIATGRAWPKGAPDPDALRFVLNLGMTGTR